jgi:hypothetical protein
MKNILTLIIVLISCAFLGSMSGQTLPAETPHLPSSSTPTRPLPYAVRPGSLPNPGNDNPRDEFNSVFDELRNPGPFQKNLAPMSGQVRMLFSARGQKLAAAHPGVRGRMQVWGMKVPALPRGNSGQQFKNQRGEKKPDTGACDDFTGAQFNLEPSTGMAELGLAVPQNETPVDFLPKGGLNGNDLVIGGANDYRGMLDPLASPDFVSVPPNAWGFSSTGYYVSRSGRGCGPDFEGGLPHMTYSPTGETLHGGGDPVFAVDSTRNLVYGADLRFGATVSAVGAFHTTVANLDSPSACPDGTHLTDGAGNDTVSSRCWPNGMLVAADTNPNHFDDKPHMRVDERKSGIGAGDVYISYTLFDSGNAVSTIELVTCPSNFGSILDCSNPLTLGDSSDSSTQFSHIAVRPDGAITISYVSSGVSNDFPAIGSLFVNIKLVTCRPNGAPNPPSCSTPSLVAHENQPIPFIFPAGLAEQLFRISTYPTHDQRFNPSTKEYEEFVVWTRCAKPPVFPIGNGPTAWVQCPASEVVMSYSTGSGANLKWSPPIPVSAGVHDQFFSWARTDHARNVVNVVYYSSENDPSGRSLQVVENNIDPGDYAPGPDHVVIKAFSNPSSDPLLGDFNPFYGDYIGITAKDGRAYIHFTGTNFGQDYGGITTGGQNNQLTRFMY